MVIILDIYENDSEYLTNNKHFFEKLLLNNIKIALKEINLKIEFAHTRYIISEFEESKIDEIINKLKTVFGIYSLSVADEIETSQNNIENYFKTFKLENTTFRALTGQTKLFQ